MLDKNWSGTKKPNSSYLRNHGPMDRSFKKKTMTSQRGTRYKPLKGKAWGTTVKGYEVGKYVYDSCLAFRHWSYGSRVFLEQRKIESRGSQKKFLPKYKDGRRVLVWCWFQVWFVSGWADHGRKEHCGCIVSCLNFSFWGRGNCRSDEGAVCFSISTMVPGLHESELFILMNQWLSVHDHLQSTMYDS